MQLELQHLFNKVRFRGFWLSGNKQPLQQPNHSLVNIIVIVHEALDWRGDAAENPAPTQHGVGCGIR